LKDVIFGSKVALVGLEVSHFGFRGFSLLLTNLTYA
jgi:hypothetical protein